MATVTIGGRELQVRHIGEAGTFLVDMAIAEAGEKSATAKRAVDQFTALAEMVFAYVKHNDPPVTLEWIISVLPADIGPVLRACVKASGREVATKGEASRPQMPQ